MTSLAETIFHSSEAAIWRARDFTSTIRFRRRNFATSR
ncbi:hypothetical protein U91I_03572 [alpha proteobacterium U9-1i]|nr:hypothetical protein U91I_03572 [alpha proteobacterium U9-1i]